MGHCVNVQSINSMNTSITTDTSVLAGPAAPSGMGVSLRVLFQQADPQACAEHPCLMPYHTTYGDVGVQHAIAATLRQFPQACIMKVESIYGELVGLAPAGLG